MEKNWLPFQKSRKTEGYFTVGARAQVEILRLFAEDICRVWAMKKLHWIHFWTTWIGRESLHLVTYHAFFIRVFAFLFLFFFVLRTNFMHLMYSFICLFQCCDQYVKTMWYCIIMFAMMHCFKNQLLSGRHRSYSCNKIFNEFIMHLCCAHLPFQWFLVVFIFKVSFFNCVKLNSSTYGHFINEYPIVLSSVKPPDWFQFQSCPFLFFPCILFLAFYQWLGRKVLRAHSVFQICKISSCWVLMARKVLTCSESLEEIIKGKKLFIMFLICKIVTMGIKIQDLYLESHFGLYTNLLE